nr:hypothetical protein [bacterium]
KFWDPDLKAYYDSETGWLVDEDDNYYNLETGFRFDDAAGAFVDDATGIHYDVDTFKPKGGAKVAAAAAAVAAPVAAAVAPKLRSIADLLFDDRTQKFCDPDLKAYYDSETGWLVDEAGTKFNLETGFRFDADADDLVDDATGIHYDKETFEAKGAAAAVAALERNPEEWTEASEPAKYFVAENYNFDSRTDYDWQITKDNYFDRVAYQIETGYAYDADTNTFIDEATGNRYDVQTHELIEGGE